MEKRIQKQIYRDMKNTSQTGTALTLVQNFFLYQINNNYHYFPLVTLLGGKNKFEGNVYLTNPNTGVYGAVCDDGWTIKNVSQAQLPHAFMHAFSVIQRFPTCGTRTPRGT